MDDPELDRFLDLVAAEVAAPYDLPRIWTQPRPANDNQIAWGFIPFPEGWNGAC